MIIAVFPGQGSQTPGFLAPWLELTGVRERLAAFSDVCEIDLVAAGTEWDADRIRDTRVAQPLIVAASLISWEALSAVADGRPAGFAGHSVGEIAALVAAGVLTDSQGMRLVGLRGRAMADAAALARTGMSAILGGDEAAVLQRLEELDLTPANYNGAGQIVAAGTLESLGELSAAPVPGTRVIPLAVAGAFHTRFMQPAVDALREAADAITPTDPATKLWTNSDGTTVASGRAALDLLVAQVASPVRWDRTMASFAGSGVTGLIEFAPAGALTGLAKRGLRGTPAVAVKTPDDLAAAAALLEEVPA
ncbi:ACP S-malonyltransferase [Microbacterium sp. P07]|uniref:ACP S-malonyltransferase n=1 Tax=Microbacterium sp. P07 TaxID=3366952 RepID=UPI003744E8A3